MLQGDYSFLSTLRGLIQGLTVFRVASCQIKKGLRAERVRKKEEAAEAEHEKKVEQKQQLLELRKAAKEAKEKAKGDPEFENDSDDEPELPGDKKEEDG